MATEVEQLIKRVDALKGEKAKALGVVESIQKKWLAEFGTDDPEKIREIVKKTEGDVEKLSKRGHLSPRPKTASEASHGRPGTDSQGRILDGSP